MRFDYRGLLVLLIGLLCSCKNSTELRSQTKKVCINHGNYSFNQTARFIAGMPIDSTSTYYTLSQSKDWKKYVKETDEGWKKFSNVAEKYRKFAQAEINPPYDTVSTLFYPFSGPDFLFANIMFPNAKKMILIGLESPGSIPDFAHVGKDLASVLEMYKIAIEDVIRLSFFRTLDMKEQLANEAIDGTTPILMLFLARSNKIIDTITYFQLNEKGIMVDIPYSEHKKANGVAIRYFSENDTVVRTIYYLSTNLADPALKQNKAFYNFLDRLDYNCVTFVKSATYLMHKSYFSIIRNTCLNHSIFILQDDSGIAYKFFDKKLWEIQLYGKYTKPIKLFEEFYEPDLYEAYQKMRVKPLNFRIGYSNPSNLLIARKIKLQH